MLQKKNRLTTRGDFKGVFQGRLRARSGPFQLVCRRNDLSDALFGFVVSLSVFKKAVRRNKLRRQLHEIIQAKILSRASGYSCVMRAFPEADELRYQDIEKHIISMFNKIKVGV